MNELKWYNKLVSQLICEREVSINGLATVARVSNTVVYNLIKGTHATSIENLEKVLGALSYDVTAIPRAEIKPLTKRDIRLVTNGENTGRLIKRKVLPGDADSYCYGCGKDGTMVRIHSHWQCSSCGYVEPCCND